MALSRDYVQQKHIMSSDSNTTRFFLKKLNQKDERLVGLNKAYIFSGAVKWEAAMIGYGERLYSVINQHHILVLVVVLVELRDVEFHIEFLVNYAPLSLSLSTPAADLHP